MRLWFAIGTLIIAFGTGGCAAPTQRQSSMLSPCAGHADRKLAEACNENGLACVQRKDWKEAERWFRLGICSDPGYSAVRNNLALVLLRRGAAKEAISELQRVCALDVLADTPRQNLNQLRAHLGGAVSRPWNAPMPVVEMDRNIVPKPNLESTTQTRSLK